ncbi:hypothetical protein ANO14919_086490 [Xylariales sp. No.14919]|nr:hypothetical protein ANO14919_086490 [Xylariales sp. No.14919]
MHFARPLVWTNVLAFFTLTPAFRNAMYIDEWHPGIPTNHSITTGITHVIMAFVDPLNFSTVSALPSPPLMPVGDVRTHFDNGTKVGVALGGWGPYSASFGLVSTAENRTTFAANLADWVEQQGYDFVDIDWEYPGGNGAEKPLDAKAEIDNLPLFLAAIKEKLRKGAFISLALAGTLDGMKAFQTRNQTKLIWDSIDFITVMAYDFFNRASCTTGHHTDVEGSRLAVQRYIDLGLPADKINLGFAFYAKYFEVDDTCSSCMLPYGCSILSAQDENGTDTFRSGVLTFESRNIDLPAVPASLQESPDGTCGYYNGTPTRYKCKDHYCCGESGWCGDLSAHCIPLCQVGYGRCDGPDVRSSFKKARENSNYDQERGGMWYFDETTSPRLFWTWENTEIMARKFDEIVNNPTYKLGGVSGWSLGENSAGWEHVQQMRNMTHQLQDPADQSHQGGQCRPS